MDRTIELEFRPIEPGDKVTGFSLGYAEGQPLKNFLKKEAKKYHSEDIAKTSVLVEPGKDNPRILGYITLICSEIECKHNAKVAENKYDKSPAIKIARLAVHKDYQGNRFGSNMVKWAITHVIENIMPRVGCRFLVVDAKKYAVKYYEERGFTLLDTEKNRESKTPLLFIDLHKTAKAI